ncbi:MAG: DegT/DnrJ/EryC1/StrS family aminotransferase [Neisseriaceae bacterium]|jgi:UDP-2-acetamido-2-deoxy-ribo-hexuluronate aminotransferase
MEFIDLKKQYEYIKQDVMKEISEVLDSGQFILGNKVNELEKQLCNYTGSKHCIGVADGTKALLIALMALDIKSGDEVIVPAFTFIATASMALLLGATPVFVDVDPISYNLDATKLEAAITKKTKAIISVSLFGQCADMNSINSIAAKHNVTVIEDAAQSFGATYKLKHSCNLSTIACTSFFPSKPLGCYGDGGACFTNNDEIASIMRQIRVHGQDRRYHHSRLGLNGRLDTLQAAVLLSKMKVFDQEVQAREQIGARYSDLLHDTDCITPKVSAGNTHIYGQYTILVENRENFVEKLKLENIPTAVHYPIPLHKQPILSKFYQGQDLLNAERLAQQVVSLPMHPYLDIATQDKIIKVIKTIC